jgi:hypothetical protein
VAAVKGAALPDQHRAVLNWRTSPLQYQHGDSVATMTVKR